MGVNLYTFGVALGPRNADFGPSNGALGPRNVFFFRFAHFRVIHPHNTMALYDSCGVRNEACKMNGQTATATVTPWLLTVIR